ncbi:sulfite exporter TauE/SafE family protein [Actinomyces timonensis]|uniref:Probable membrane transporter protein n=1 Tax=Actinomyces timonensis TaxID=1288391 RepID=A0AAU8MZR8_9ACTO
MGDRPAVGRLALAACVGLGAGVLSGLFGVGGGLVLVPALVAILGMGQRRAAATSLVAIIPASLAGTVTYALRGDVSLAAALIIVLGSLAGARMGACLLAVLPARVLPWIFIAFAASVLVMGRAREPVREAALSLDGAREPGAVAALVGIGLIAGLLAGLVGVGGGVVIVPGLEMLAGAGDLLARGTSLAAMAPTAIAGTVSNLRRGLPDARIGIVVGLASVIGSPLGAVVAREAQPEGRLMAVLRVHRRRDRLRAGTGAAAPGPADPPPRESGR